jgi:hypothetical protein
MMYSYGLGGAGGNGLGGNGYAVFASLGNDSIHSCTFTQQSIVSEGHGGAGGLNGNNTIQADSGQSVNGEVVIFGATIAVTNSIVWNNVTTSVNHAAAVIYSCIQGGFPGQGNISSDPQFVAGPAGAYYLPQIAAGQTVNSPCLDAGNPTSSMLIGTTRTDQVQDAGVVDMGYHYPLGMISPQIDVTLTPLNPPIVIPAQGGSFNFNASVVNNGPAPVPFSVWAGVRFPDSSWQTTLGPVNNLNPPVGVTITRLRIQNVPGSWPAGQYTYVGYCALTYPGTVIDSSFFTFSKSTAGDGGATVWEASCTGEPFSGERSMTAAVPSGLDLNIAPNPFNPNTAISFNPGLNPGLVSLRIYDTAGRLVTTLVDGWREAGTHVATFDGSALASGLYFVRIEARSLSAVQKMMLVK